MKKGFFKSLTSVSKYNSLKKIVQKNKPVKLPDYLYHFQNSILFYEVPFQAMPEQSRSHEALPYQNQQRSCAIMACNPVAVLPGMQNNADG
jgi:hypothetical protein